MRNAVATWNTCASGSTRCCDRRRDRSRNTAPGSAAVAIRFRSGTLEINGIPAAFAGLPSACAWDERTACFRAPASAYADLVRSLRRLKIAYSDQARQYQTLTAGAVVRREPRPYQSEALAAWDAAGGRGVVVLPTGAGKTLVAHMAIDLRRRSTLVVTPTLDLVRQWHDGLVSSFGVPVASSAAASTTCGR